jgi:hypothetical protein
MTDTLQRGASRHLLSIAFPQALGIFLTVSLSAQPAVAGRPSAQSGAASLAAAQAQGVTQPFLPASDATEGRIKLDAVVTDQSGRPVSGLARKDFALLDNGQRNNILSLTHSTKSLPSLILPLKSFWS